MAGVTAARSTKIETDSRWFPSSRFHDYLGPNLEMALHPRHPHYQ